MTVSIPPAFTMAWPTVQAMTDLGGSGTNDEIARRVSEILALTEEQQAEPHPGGSRTEVEYRLAWARTLLKNIGALENSARGVWSLTERGRTLDEADVMEGYRTWRAEMIARRRDQLGADAEVDATDRPEAIAESEPDWEQRLLSVVLDMDPVAFERLFVRILKEAGFANVKTTVASGDEGIDGTGVYSLSLVSFPVYFQCKRWRSCIGSREIRDFRGAMVGRADHALFVTTSSFTPSARVEANRPGAPPIDLIDGERLCSLLREFSLGVRATPRTVFDISVDEVFFQNV